MAEHGDIAEEDSDAEEKSKSIGSEDGESLILPRASKLVAGDGACSGSSNPKARMTPHEACRRAAAEQGIAWPPVLTETSSSEEKRLPKPESSARFTCVPGGGDAVMERSPLCQKPQGGSA
ncbi:hypothetical protein VZT92_026345 [Zoarces viviparus]|uniref:Prolactin receptor n=1 Tax=Zoarces viviparus TaxID=48416 RepID=A0AAW1E040_ZOAVI